MKYVIMQSAFDNYWIGKTKLTPPDGAKVFDDFEGAREEAMSLCIQCENRDELEFMKEDEVEDEITDESMWKWLA
jgi:hypothetical protein